MTSATLLDGAGESPLIAGAKRAVEAALPPLAAILVAAVLFGLFLWLIAGVNPFDVYALMYQGAFATSFSWNNTLVRAAPLLLSALCTALPAHLGLVIIGNEGALVLGGLAAAAVAVPLFGQPAGVIWIATGLAAAIAGGAWIALAGALRQFRGVNETISSLLLTYIAIALFNHIVEGPLRDPASLNKPSTLPVPEALMIGAIPGSEVHFGLLIGLVFCVIAFVLMRKTTFGFAARVVGGNIRAARLAGLPVGWLTIVVCALGGAAAGLAGMIEVMAVHGSANASLNVGYGYAGILVAFLARQNPLAIVPVAILLGGINASGGLLQRRLDLPDATVLVLQGILFVVLLASESLAGRIKLFGSKEG